MELARNIILLLVGIAVFMTGMSMMSSGLKKATGPQIKNLFDKFKNNRFKGLAVGAGTTAIIQSSAATSVMSIGFVNAGVMSVFQAESVIMGAHIGTTVTGLLVSLSSLSGAKIEITFYFMLFAFIGIVLSFFKNKLVKDIGEIATGLGLLFFGLFTLKDAFNSAQINAFTQSVFAAISNPLLLLIIGAVFTMLVQSSSASTGIMIVMCAAGAVDVSSAIWVALGATIGTLLPTLLAAIGGSTNSKKVALIDSVMRISLAFIFLAVMWPVDAATGFISKSASIFPSEGLYIAVFMVIYNIITMFIAIPFIERFEGLANKLIKDAKKDELQSYIKFIDAKLLATPDIALMQVKKEIEHMNELAYENYNRGFNAILNTNTDEEDEINKCEEGIDFLNEKITDYLISLSGQRNFEHQEIVGGYFHAINDIERIGDHASNFLDNAIKMKELGLKFSPTALEELTEFNDVLNNMFKLSQEILETGDRKLIQKLHELEEKTDDLKDKISSAHFNRITKGDCKIELSPFLSTLVSELERVADHLTNVAYIQLNPTGKDD